MFISPWARHQFKPGRHYGEKMARLHSGKRLLRQKAANHDLSCYAQRPNMTEFPLYKQGSFLTY
jgi:hypothetical protein